MMNRKRRSGDTAVIVLCFVCVVLLLGCIILGFFCLELYQKNKEQRQEQFRVEQELQAAPGKAADLEAETSGSDTESDIGSDDDPGVAFIVSGESDSEQEADVDNGEKIETEAGDAGAVVQVSAAELEAGVILSEPELAGNPETFLRHMTSSREM